MGLLLSILAERKSYYDKDKQEWLGYCNMNQMVYFDIGFDTGVPLGRLVIRIWLSSPDCFIRVVIELKSSYNKPLSELFVKIARGEFVHPAYGENSYQSYHVKLSQCPRYPNARLIVIEPSYSRKTSRLHRDRSPSHLVFQEHHHGRRRALQERLWRMCARVQQGLPGEQSPVQCSEYVSPHPGSSQNFCFSRGKLVLLPSDTNPTLFSSLFYILLDKSAPSIVDGCIIGDVIEGIETLDAIVKEYGTESGRPVRKLTVHQCGHL